MRLASNVQRPTSNGTSGKLSLAALVLLGGCALHQEPRTASSNLYPDVRVVAVLPFVNQSREPRVDGVEMANIMANEMTKLYDVRVVRPGTVVPTTADEALRWGRAAKADAVLVAAVTDYDPYEPPRISLSIQLLRVQGRSISSAEIDRIVQSASWRRGPLPLGRDRASNWTDAFEAVYDAHDAATRKGLLAYAADHVSGDSGFTPEREMVAVQSRYLQFVSSQVLKRLFEPSSLE